MTDKEQSCILVLDGIDEGDINIALYFSDKWDRLAKLRDLINAQLLRELAKAQQRVANERAARVGGD